MVLATKRGQSLRKINKMQTFLPYPDLLQSVRVLDYRRLGKQRVETFQVLNILLDRTPTKGWRNHPVTRMWTGYEEALKLYQNFTIEEWVKRGYKNTMQFEELDYKRITLPNWFGNKELHRSHRSNLLRKDYEYYSQYFDEPADLEYYWPV
jgi:Pyrimidine dimer DNA glycosylase